MAKYVVNKYVGGPPILLQSFIKYLDEFVHIHVCLSFYVDYSPTFAIFLIIFIVIMGMKISIITLFVHN